MSEIPKRPFLESPKKTIIIPLLPDELLEVVAVRMRLSSPDLDKALLRTTRIILDLMKAQGDEDYYEARRGSETPITFRLPS